MRLPPSALAVPAAAEAAPAESHEEPLAQTSKGTRAKDFSGPTSAINVLSYELKDKIYTYTREHIFNNFLIKLLKQPWSRATHKALKWLARPQSSNRQGPLPLEVRTGVPVALAALAVEHRHAPLQGSLPPRHRCHLYPGVPTWQLRGRCLSTSPKRTLRLWPLCQCAIREASTASKLFPKSSFQKRLEEDHDVVAVASTPSGCRFISSSLRSLHYKTSRVQQRSQAATERPVTPFWSSKELCLGSRAMASRS